MDPKDIVKAIMSEKGYSQERLAEESGMKRQSNVTGILNRGASLRVDKLDQMISAMGYKMVIVPECVECAAGWYEITTEQEANV